MKKHKTIALLNEEIKIFERSAVDALASDELLGRRRLGQSNFLHLHAEMIWDSIKINWEALDEIKWFQLTKWIKAKELRRLRSKFSTSNLIRKLSVLEIFQIVREIYLLETGEKRDYLEVALGNISKEEILKRNKPKKKVLNQAGKQSKH